MAKEELLESEHWRIFRLFLSDPSDEELEGVEEQLTPATWNRQKSKSVQSARDVPRTIDLLVKANAIQGPALPLQRGKARRRATRSPVLRKNYIDAHAAISSEYS
jgi:hypothetical protein